LRAAEANLSCEAIDAASALLSTLDWIARSIGFARHAPDEKNPHRCGLLSFDENGNRAGRQTTPAPCA
jgi:hypothetical protein